MDSAESKNRSRPRNRSGPEKSLGRARWVQGQVAFAPAAPRPAFPGVPALGLLRVPFPQNSASTPTHPFPARMGSPVAPDPYGLFPTGTQAARVMERVRRNSLGPGVCGGRVRQGPLGRVGEPRWSGGVRAGGHTASPCGPGLWLQHPRPRRGPMAHVAWPLPFSAEVGPCDGACSTQ